MKADRGDLQVLAVIATAHSPARGWAEVAEAGPAAHPHGAIGIDSITSTRLCRFVTLLPETAWRVVLRCLFAAGCGAWPPGGGEGFPSSRRWKSSASWVPACWTTRLEL